MAMNALVGVMLTLAIGAQGCEDPYFNYVNAQNLDCGKIRQIHSRFQATKDDYFQTVVRMRREYDRLEQKLPELQREFAQKQADCRKKTDELRDVFDSLVTKVIIMDDEWKTTEQELKLGLYCSKCTRSKSEIERDGHTIFSQHVTEVKGEAVHAPAELIRKKHNEYRARRQQARQKYIDYEKNVLERWYTEEDAIYDEMNKKIRNVQAELVASVEKGRELGARIGKCYETMVRLRTWCHW